MVHVVDTLNWNGNTEIHGKNNLLENAFKSSACTSSRCLADMRCLSIQTAIHDYEKLAIKIGEQRQSIRRVLYVRLKFRLWAVCMLSMLRWRKRTEKFKLLIHVAQVTRQPTNTLTLSEWVELNRTQGRNTNALLPGIRSAYTCSVRQFLLPICHQKCRPIYSVEWRCEKADDPLRSNTLEHLCRTGQIQKTHFKCQDPPGLPFHNTPTYDISSPSPKHTHI